MNAVHITIADSETIARRAMVHDAGDLPPLEGASFGRGLAVAIVVYAAAMVVFGLFRVVTTGEPASIGATLIIAIGMVALSRRLGPAHDGGEA
jgi:hypothetical protein